MKNIFSLVLIVIGLLFSCDQQKNTEESSSDSSLETTDTLQIAMPENLKPRIRLTTQAREGVENWTFYNNLIAAIDSVPATSLKMLKTHLEPFTTIYKTAEEAEEASVSLTPPEVNTNAINARLLAIETRLHALQNEANRNAPDATTLSNQIGELQNAHQDLNLQLNELYSTSIKDLLEEIRKENKDDINLSEPSGLIPVL